MKGRVFLWYWNCKNANCEFEVVVGEERPGKFLLRASGMPPEMFSSLWVRAQSVCCVTTGARLARSVYSFLSRVLQCRAGGALRSAAVCTHSQVWDGRTLRESLHKVSQHKKPCNLVEAGKALRR